MPSGKYERTELTISRLQHSTTNNKINRLLNQLKAENSKLAQLEARINELQEAESE